MTPRMRDHGFTESSFYVVDSYKLNDFFCLFFPQWKNQDFATVMECGNDTGHNIAVTGNLDSWDQQGFEKFQAGAQPWCGTPRILMDILCSRGELPAGNYLVEVCW